MFCLGVLPIISPLVSYFSSSRYETRGCRRRHYSLSARPPNLKPLVLADLFWSRATSLFTQIRVQSEYNGIERAQPIYRQNFGLERMSLEMFTSQNVSHTGLYVPF